VLPRSPPGSPVLAALANFRKTFPALTSWAEMSQLTWFPVHDPPEMI